MSHTAVAPANGAQLRRPGTACNIKLRKGRMTVLRSLPVTISCTKEAREMTRLRWSQCRAPAALAHGQEAILIGERIAGTVKKKTP